jgi:formamidopyrimidine-DNA glycosylase
MKGARFDRVILNRRDLRQPFPRGFARRLRGQMVRSLSRRGKYLLGELSSGDTLVMHLGMTGHFRVVSSSEWKRRPRDRDTDLENRHDHVLFTMSSGVAVVFSDPRRFGMMDLVRAGDAPEGSALALIGPEPLSRAFDAAALASRCAHRKIALKLALLDQRTVAGIGNIYASEVLHLARLSPFRRAATIATPSGAPREGARRLAAAIKSVLRHAMSLTESELYRQSRWRVYDREGEPCLTPGCHGTIRRIAQGGRSTFYCPVCQK